MRIEGTAEQPVEIFRIADRRGTWDAIRLYEKARGNLIEHTTLRNAGGEGAINVAMGVDAIVRDVSCVRCFSPTLTWACGARVTAERVKAGARDARGHAGAAVRLRPGRVSGGRQRRRHRTCSMR